MQAVLAALAFSVGILASAAALADSHFESRASESSDDSGDLFGDIFSSETKTKVTSGQGTPDINEVQMEAYDGPKARIAVSRFTDKTGTGWWNGGIGDGMADQLATALFSSNRYILLERQTLKDVLYEQDLATAGRIRAETAAPTGRIEGAELLILGAVTEFQRSAEGSQGALGGLIGGTFGGILGALSGGVRKAHIAIDIRVIDTKTSRIVAATSIEGEASDVNMSGLLGGAVGGGALGGALGSWKNTPIEKALRICIQRAVEFVVSKTPPVYYRHGVATTQAALVQPTTQPQPAAQPQQRPPAPVYASGTVVRVKSAKLNMRSGPDTLNPVIQSLTGGTPLLVKDQVGDWIQVMKEGGQLGWVASWLTYPDGKLSAADFQSVGVAPTPVADKAPTPSAKAAGGGDKDDSLARLKRLKKLYEAELISEEEYNAKKQEILSEL